MAGNVDETTVRGFGTEWERFDQSRLSAEERKRHFERYFAVFPWECIDSSSVGADVGCGTGRWALEVAPRVGKLHLIDASAAAVAVARENLAGHMNCEFHVASVDALPVPDSSLDFAYSVGVLHHVPDTFGGLQSTARKLKPGAPLLAYLYYALDGRPFWFRAIWRTTDGVRRVVSRLPSAVKLAFSTVVASFVYLPLARTAALLERHGFDVENFPLSIYRNRSFYSMRTDAFDRFSTRLERRFRREEIRSMLERAGFERIVFSDEAPYWCVVGYRSADG